MSASRQYQGNNVKLLGEAGFLVMYISTMCSSLIRKHWVDVASGSDCQKDIYAHCIPVIIDLFFVFVFCVFLLLNIRFAAFRLYITAEVRRNVAQRFPFFCCCCCC